MPVFDPGDVEGAFSVMAVAYSMFIRANRWRAGAHPESQNQENPKKDRPPHSSILASVSEIPPFGLSSASHSGSARSQKLPAVTNPINLGYGHRREQ